eukprot:974554-Pyramimonas_sp.AAC.1
MHWPLSAPASGTRWCEIGGSTRTHTHHTPRSLPDDIRVTLCSVLETPRPHDLPRPTQMPNLNNKTTFGFH